MLTAGLSVAGGGAATALVLYALSRASRDPLFPPAGPVRPAVNGLALAGAFLVFIFTPFVAHLGLAGAGFFRWLYGSDFPGGWPEPAANTVRSLWTAALAFPVQVALVVCLARAG